MRRNHGGPPIRSRRAFVFSVLLFGDAQQSCHLLLLETGAVPEGAGPAKERHIPVADI